MSKTGKRFGTRKPKGKKTFKRSTASQPRHVPLDKNNVTPTTQLMPQISPWVAFNHGQFSGPLINFERGSTLNIYKDVGFSPTPNKRVPECPRLQNTPFKSGKRRQRSLAVSKSPKRRKYSHFQSRRVTGKPGSGTTWNESGKRVSGIMPNLATKHRPAAKRSRSTKGPPTSDVGSYPSSSRGTTFTLPIIISDDDAATLDEEYVSMEEATGGREKYLPGPPDRSALLGRDNRDLPGVSARSHLTSSPLSATSISELLLQTSIFMEALALTQAVIGEAPDLEDPPRRSQIQSVQPNRMSELFSNEPSSKTFTMGVSMDPGKEPLIANCPIAPTVTQSGGICAPLPNPGPNDQMPSATMDIARILHSGITVPSTYPPDSSGNTCPYAKHQMRHVATYPPTNTV
ncbi:hypothetical protein JCM33374_g6508 [Metschnikowia sp. JCM 33374]|nr:hypothetical protein JCM33374_g6508 [Metschnikowia sp. JCM 33374]